MYLRPRGTQEVAEVCSVGHLLMVVRWGKPRQIKKGAREACMGGRVLYVTGSRQRHCACSSEVRTRGVMELFPKTNLDPYLQMQGF